MYNRHIIHDYNKNLSRFMGVSLEGVWIGEYIYIYYFYTPLGTILCTSLAHTQTSVLSLLQSPLAVSWQRLLTREIIQRPLLRYSSYSLPCKTQLTGSTDWRPFHTNYLVFSSQADFQLASDLSHSPTSYFMSLLSNELLTTSQQQLQLFASNYPVYNISSRTT
jgi:hypothetical protein